MENTPLTGKVVWLRLIVVIGLLAALPLAFFRYQTETEHKQVEIVMDYTDMIAAASNESNPMQAIVQTLSFMKQNKITSIAVDEMSFEDVRMQHRMFAWSGEQIAQLDPLALDLNDTYLAFVNDEGLSEAEPTRLWIQKALAEQGIASVEWSVPRGLRTDNKVVEQGLRVAKSIEQLKATLVGIDPLALQQVLDAGLQPVIKLSNRIKPFDPAKFSRDVTGWREAGVKRMIIFGDEVPGFDYVAKNSKVDQVAEILRANEIGLASIEMLKKPPAGFNSLAEKTGYNVVRMHAINEKDPLLIQSDLEDAKDQLVDRLALAVKDRGIRMVYLNAKWFVDRERLVQINPLPLMFEVLNASDGVIADWAKQGYTPGIALPMKDQTPLLLQGMKMLVAAAALAWIVIMIRYFVSIPAVLLLALGVAGSAAIGFLSIQWLWKLLALGVGIAAPVCAILLVLNKQWITGGSKDYSRLKSAGLAIRSLFYATAVSLGGALLIVGLLNEIPYYLVLDQYRGVVLLHSVPLALAAVYAMFYWKALDWQDVFARVRSWLEAPLKIAGLIAFVIGAGAFAYYLTRTGNDGAVSSVEKMYRAYLESFFGVRPRTKEFLIAHPLFLLAAYAWRVPRWRLAAVLAGALGQLSIVDTFAHLHTPLDVSLIRVGLGIAVGIVLFAGYAVFWELVRGSWKRWASRYLS